MFDLLKNSQLMSIIYNILNMDSYIFYLSSSYLLKAKRQIIETIN